MTKTPTENEMLAALEKNPQIGKTLRELKEMGCEITVSTTKDRE